MIDDISKENSVTMIDDILNDNSLTASELLAALVLGSLVIPVDIPQELRDLLEQARQEQRTSPATNAQYDLWREIGRPQVAFRFRNGGVEE